MTTGGTILACPRCGTEHKKPYVAVGFLNDARADLARLRDVVELAIHAWLPLAPVNGSWGSGYSLNERIDPVLRATPEEWADAGQALCDLHRLCAALGDAEQNQEERR